MENIFVRFKSPVAVILLLILAGGVFSYNSTKTSLFPNVTFPKIKSGDWKIDSSEDREQFEIRRYVRKNG